MWTGANAPSGYLPTAADYLTDTSLIAGNASMTDPDGSAVTGHSGDGYIRITVIEAGIAAPDNLRQTSKDYTEIGIAWDAVEDAAGYKVYRDGTLIATQSGTAYIDTGLLPASEYIYGVSAYTSEDESDTAELAAETEFAYYRDGPVITAAAFSVNPTNINTKTVLSVTVAEELVILKPDYYYSGEAYAGEV